MMKSICLHIAFFLLLILSAGNLYSQDKIDSLLNELSRSKDEKSRLSNLQELAWEYYGRSDYVSALHYADEGLQIAHNLGDREGEVNCLNLIASCHDERSDYPQALNNYFAALKIAGELKDRHLQSILLLNLGVTYYAQKDYSKALVYYMRVLKLLEGAGPAYKEDLISTLGNIGLVYADMGDTRSAMLYSSRALRMAEEAKSEENIVNALANIGSIYGSEAKAEKDPATKDQLFTLAVSSFFKALQLSDKIKDRGRSEHNLGELGGIYFEMKNFKEAQSYLAKAISLADSIGDLDGLQQWEKKLSEVCTATGRHTEAFEHYKKHIALHDSITNKDKTELKTRAELQFEFDKKQVEDSLKTATEKKIASARLRSEKNKRYSLYTGLVLVLIFAGFMFNRFRVARKQKIVIEEQKRFVEAQKAFIEEKQREVMESILYAKRIQTALLPTDRYIQKNIRQL
jgi:tetratricopeptide (TPR) repeat protein